MSIDFLKRQDLTVKKYHPAKEGDRQRAVEEIQYEQPDVLFPPEVENKDEGPAGNQEVNVENRQQERQIADNVIFRPNGILDVTNLKFPPKRGEGKREGVQRRKKELDALVPNGVTGAGVHGVFVNALSEQVKDDIEERIANGEIRETIANEYKRNFNQIFGNFSNGISEEEVIGLLIGAKGAEYYARE